MGRIKLVVEYDGTNFAGYQVQPGKRTVQGELEKALESIFQTKVTTFASGRTDAKVHALHQVVHFDMPHEIKNTHLDDSLNAFLPSDIRVVSFQRVSSEFDARFSPKKKTYGYKFYLSRCERPLYLNRALRVNENINIEKMQSAAKLFVGTHDFSSFVSKKSGKTNFVRTIYSCEIVKTTENEYMLKITGNGFLYNMVRIIMGTLLFVGEGKFEEDCINKILEAKSRKMAGKTAPPYALYLLDVEY